MNTKHIVTGAAGVAVMVGAVLGAGNWLQAGQESVHRARRFNCTTATLEGTYAIIGGGLVPSGPPPALLNPFAHVSMMALDGRGNLSDKITLSDNGQVVRRVQPGTYKVNDDCTGEMTIIVPDLPFPLTFDLVLAELQGAAQGSKEFYAIGSVTPNGGVVTFTAKRIQ